MSKLALISSKIVSQEEAQRVVNRWKIKNDVVVFTNGVFDLLHKGHVTYLHEAATCGDRLIVGLNSDASAKLLGKGGNRPLQDEETRALLLAAMTYVDAVVLFDEETPEALIQKLSPNFLVKGGDYTISEIAGADFVQSQGGAVKTIPLVKGFSTTALEEKIKNG